MPANTVTLEGTLVTAPEFRYTPSGRLVASLEVEHCSQEGIGDRTRRIELRIPVQALDALAERCRPLVQGVVLRLEGTLNQKRWIRDGRVRWGKTELLAKEITPLDRLPDPPQSL